MPSTLSETTTGTKLIGLDVDYFFAPPAGSSGAGPVLIDRDSNADITLAPGASLTRLSVLADATGTLGIKQTAGEIELSAGGLATGSDIKINGVVIGNIALYDGQNLDIDFNAATTPDAAEAIRAAAVKLLRALIYTNQDTAATSRGANVMLIVYDSNDGGDAALAQTADRILGDGAANTITVQSSHISFGDEISGGAGADILQLTGGGTCKINDASKFEGIETVQGSTDDDAIYLSSANLATLSKIDGGGQAGDYLYIEGSTIDFRGKVVTGFSHIVFGLVGTSILMDDATTAKLLDGKFASGETLAITGGALSDAERLALHRDNQIDTITHAGRTTTLADTIDKTLKGTKGKNALNGALGADKLYGDYGNDTLSGGFGKDVFVFNSKLGSYKTDRSVNVDTIKDFSTADDTIWLDNAVFKKLGKGSESAPKKLSKAFFTIGTKAKDKNDYVIYDKKTGYLSYDADGSGSKFKAIEFAKLAKNLKLTHDDFGIV